MSGHYSPSLRRGALLFVSGQVAPPATLAAPADTGLEAQTRACLEKLRALLDADGASLEQVAKVTVFLADMQGAALFDRVYAEFFGAHKPARTLVPTAEFPHGILIEIDAIAVLAD